MPRYNLRKLLYVTAVLSVVFCGMALANRIYREFWYGINDAYAKWGAADMVVDYMHDHDGQWPDGWDSLAPYFAQSHGRCGGWPFEQYQDRIWVDFDVDIETLEQHAMLTELADYKVIGAYFSSSSFGDGPNQQIHDYFRRELGLATASSTEGRIAQPPGIATTDN